MPKNASILKLIFKISFQPNYTQSLSYEGVIRLRKSCFFEIFPKINFSFIVAIEPIMPKNASILKLIFKIIFQPNYTQSLSYEGVIRLRKSCFFEIFPKINFSFIVAIEPIMPKNASILKLIFKIIFQPNYTISLSYEGVIRLRKSCFFEIFPKINFSFIVAI